MDRAKWFLEELFDEKERGKENHHTHVLYKSSFVTALLRFGSLRTKVEISKPSIYWMPNIALCHNIYIFRVVRSLTR